jgi:hypothetical protein
LTHIPLSGAPPCVVSVPDTVPNVAAVACAGPTASRPVTTAHMVTALARANGLRNFMNILRR